jgi:hypothetical protein
MAADHERALQTLKDDRTVGQREQQQQAERDRLALESAHEAAMSTLRAESAAQLSTLIDRLHECQQQLELAQSSWQADKLVWTFEKTELQQQHEARILQLRDEMETHVRTERDASETLRPQISLLNQQLLSANDELQSSQNQQVTTQQHLEKVQREWDSANKQWIKQQEQLEQSLHRTREEARQAAERAQAELIKMASKHAQEIVARFVCVLPSVQRSCVCMSFTLTCFVLLVCLQCNIK